MTALAMSSRRGNGPAGRLLGPRSISCLHSLTYVARATAPAKRPSAQTIWKTASYKKWVSKIIAISIHYTHFILILLKNAEIHGKNTENETIYTETKVHRLEALTCSSYWFQFQQYYCQGLIIFLKKNFPYKEYSYTRVLHGWPMHYTLSKALAGDGEGLNDAFLDSIRKIWSLSSCQNEFQFIHAAHGICVGEHALSA